MKEIIKFLLVVGVFIILFIYSFKNVIDLKGLISQYKNIHPTYISLKQKSDTINQEVSIMSNKVLGIRENTLNKEILEERAKSMMSYRNISEIVINN
ncbi:hypothetical protein ACFX5K_02055 [Rickettsiales bacterium LUAb2]